MIEITLDTVRELIDCQFPQWAGLPIKNVEVSGHDNRTFRLGNELAVRLPSHERYVAAVEKEMKYLPVLAKNISIPITLPLAKGKPARGYPFPWSVNCWIDGQPVTHTNISSLNEFADDLVAFLKELEAIDASDGIPAGEHNFYRGGNLSVYEEETKNAISHVAAIYDKTMLLDIWELALASKWDKRPVWVHGDIATGNLLVKNGRLCGVIDFGTMGTGDPSCDFAIAWNFFDQESRRRFFQQSGAGDDLVNRARGWSLWKALITFVENDPSSELAMWGKRVIDTVIKEYTQAN